MKIENGKLYCPRCGGDWLHHDKVEVFEREEDAETGLHVVVDGAVSLDTDLEGNPSSRRHGLKVHVWCETCPANSVLTISQHKGSTLIDLEEIGGYWEECPNKAMKRV